MLASSAPLLLAEGLSREFLLHHRLCPQRRAENGGVVVATAPDSLLDALDDIAFAYRAAVTTELSTTDEVSRLIERLTNRSERTIELARADTAADDLATDVRDLANQPPVIRYVNLLVRDAYDAAASDIHLEATRNGLSARFRLDGVLAPAPEPPAPSIKRSSRASNYSRSSTSPSVDARRMAAFACASRRASSISVSPRCRRSTARASCCASSIAAVARSA